MTEETKSDKKQADRTPGQQGSVGTAVMIINGLLVSIAMFLALHFVTKDIRSLEVRNQTRDILQSTLQSMLVSKNSVKALAQHLVATEGVAFNQALDRFLPLMMPEIESLEQVFWTDLNQNVYYGTIGIDQETQLLSVAPNQASFLSYEDMQELAKGMEPDQIRTLTNMPRSFRQEIMQEDNKRSSAVGLLVKMPGPDGKEYMLLIIAQPESFLGASWADSKRKDIVGVRIVESDTGHHILNKKYGENGAPQPFFASVPITYLLNMGEKVWELHLDVMLATSSQVIRLMPLIMLILGLVLTAVSAAYFYTKQKQALKLAEMSETLEGTSGALKTSLNEQEKLVNALRKSEREKRALINSVSDVIFETDENGILVFLNETWVGITDIETDAALNRSLFDMLHPEEQEAEFDRFRRLVSGEQHAYRTEVQIKTGQNVYKTVELAISMLRIADDKSIRVVGTITDIEKRRRAEMALREAERKYRAIFENSISGIYQSTSEGRFLSANPALARILGYDDPHDLSETVTNIGKQIYVSPKDRVSFASAIEKNDAVSGLETEVYTKDGTRIWITENARAVRDEEGKLQYYEGSIEDITKRRAADEALREAKIQADITNRAKSEFLANMSHELRTPLNAIIGFSEIIKDEIMGEVSGDYREYAKDIYEGGNYLLKVISEILEVSKIETGDRQLQESAFTFEQAVTSCLTIMGSKIDNAGLTLEKDIPEDLPEIWGEELAMKQILLNLMNNAVKFTETGGTIKLSAKTDTTGRMIIEVTDSGIGMTEEEIEKAMTPFGQNSADHSGAHSGTGLGLTIVDSLVRLHEGHIKLISQKGVGTTVRITMPTERVLHGAEKKDNDQSA